MDVFDSDGNVVAIAVEVEEPAFAGLAARRRRELHVHC